MKNGKSILKKKAVLFSGLAIIIVLFIGLTAFLSEKSQTIHVRNQVIREYYLKHPQNEAPSLTREYVYTGSANYKLGKSWTYHSQKYINVKNNTYVKASYVNYLKNHPSNPKYSQKLVNKQFIKEYRQGALDTINAFRQANGRSKLNLSNKLNRVAQVRAYQVMEPKNRSLWADGESIHYNSKHQGVGALVAVKLGIYPSYQVASSTMSENLATEGNQLFNDNSINGIYKSASQAYRGGCGFMQLYINEGPTGSHYQNLLATTRKSVGIGFGANKNQVSDVEEFADNYMS